MQQLSDRGRYAARFRTWRARLRRRLAAVAAALIAGFVALAMPAVGTASAQGGVPETALKKLAADSFPDTIAAIGEIALSASAGAAAVLEALADGRLMFASDGTIVVRGTDGRLTDLRTQQAVATAPSGLSAVRLNNRVRQTLQAALGGLVILSPDAGKRRDAALGLVRSKDARSLDALETAIGRETDSSIKAIMETARAAILVVKPDAPLERRLAAVAALEARSNQDAVAALKSVPADADPSLVTAAGRAIESIEGRLKLWEVVQNLWYGLSLGSVLLLAAIGLAITFGVMGVINMAHGEMVMLGAYTTFVVQETLRAYAPGIVDWSLAIALPMAFLAAGVIGIAIERGVIRKLYGRPLETLLATWGISLILQQAVRTAFGPTNREVSSPPFMTGAFEVGGLAITWNRLYIIIFAGVIFATLLLALRHTALGLQMRAVTQNRRMAASMGIPTSRVDALTFGLGSGIAGLAGVALSQIDNVSPNLGQSYIIDSFLVVVFGGVGNLWGTLVGALSLGVANKLLEPYAGAVLGKILLLVIIILFIQKRPRGLFALKGRAVEA
jgi:urea transport system permease protein